MAESRPHKRPKLTHERNPFIDDEAVVDRDDPEEEAEEEDEKFIEDELGEDLDEAAVYAQVNAALRAEEVEADLRARVDVREDIENDDEEIGGDDNQTGQPQVMSPIETEGHTWNPGTWARFRGPKLYRGDIGFIFSRKNTRTGQSALWVALVPRMDIHGAQTSRSARPPPQTLNAKDVARLFDMNIEFGRDFYFRHKTFNYSGYLLLPLENADLYPAKSFSPIPLLEEFERFLRLPALSQKKWSEHRLTVWQQHGSRANDRIKLQAGPYSGMVGILLGRTNQEAEVYLPAQDEVVNVVVADMQIELQHGDHVRVVNGEYAGLVGYITSLSDEWVDITEPRDEVEIRVLALDVEFYKAPTVIVVQSHSFEVGDEVVAISGPHTSKAGLVQAIHDGWLVVTPGPDVDQIDIFYRDARHTTSPKTNKIRGLMNKSQIDMYSLYKGRHCLISRGPYKSYRGIIKVTHPDGRLGVQLDTRLQEIIHFAFDDVLVEEKKLAMALPPPVSAFTAEPPAIIPERRPISIPFPDVDIEQMPSWPLARKLSVPISPFEPQPLPLDHPSLTLPVPTWLLSGEFVPHRIRLVDINCDGPGMEYYMPADNGEVFVRAATTTRKVPVANLRHKMPEQPLDLVVPIVGEFKGQLMKVKEYGKDECSLTVNGAKRIRRKGYEFPRCRTQDLAMTLPPRVQ